MIELDNRTNINLDLTTVEQIYSFLTEDDVELIFVYDDEMKELNCNFRDVDKSTDVLSFPLAKMPNSPLGTIIVNTDKVITVSKELGHHPHEEMALLFTHGLLHLLGYDHEKDSGQMREKEVKIMKHFNLPKSLIERTV